jgi:translation initiation factor 1
MSIENLKTFDPFAEADDGGDQVKQSQQDYIHIRIQRTCPQLLVANPF